MTSERACWWRSCNPQDGGHVCFELAQPAEAVALRRVMIGEHKAEVLSVDGKARDPAAGHARTFAGLRS